MRQDTCKYSTSFSATYVFRYAVVVVFFFRKDDCVGKAKIKSDKITPKSSFSKLIVENLPAAVRKSSFHSFNVCIQLKNDRLLHEYKMKLEVKVIILDIYFILTYKSTF